MGNRKYVTRYQTWFYYKSNSEIKMGRGVRNKIANRGLGWKGDCNWNPLRRGSNFDKNAKPGANRNLWFFARTDFGTNKNEEFQQGISVSWVGNKTPKVATTSFAGGIQAVLYVFDMARMLKGLLSELLLGNIGEGVPTFSRNDNSAVVYQVVPVNTATNENG